MKAHVIFDLDGTLIDSAKGIYNAFVKSCEKVGLVPPKLKEFKKHIGPPIQVITQNIFENAASEEVKQIEREFRKLYDKSEFLQYKVYNGADRTINRLSKDKHIVMSIVTNKPTLLANKIIEKQGWKDYFSIVVGIDFPHVMYSKSKFTSKSEAINYAVEVSRVKHNRTCYLGDTVGDRHASKQNGIRFIAAKYGFYNWEQDEIRDQLSIRKIEELLELIYKKKYWINRS